MRTRLTWYAVGLAVGAWLLHALVDQVFLGGSLWLHLFRGYNIVHLVHRLVLVGMTAALGVALVVQFRRLRAGEREREEIFNQYRTMADFTWDWEYWKDEHGQFVYISPSCERVTGRPPQEFLRDPGLLAAIVHPDYREWFIAHERAALADRHVIHHEVFPVVRPDGTERWVDHYCLPVFDQRGTWRGRRVSNRDITEQKRAEEMVHLTQYAVEHTGEALFWIAADGSIHYANQAAAVMTGRSREDLLALKVWDVWPDTDAERWKDSWQELRRTPNSTGEYRLRRADGSVIPVEVMVNYLAFGDREYNFVFVRDISERVRAHAEVAERERMFRSIVEATPLGMHFYRLEDDGRLIFEGANPAADRILGVDNRQFIGMTIEEAFPPLAATEVLERYRAAARDGALWHTQQFAYEDRRIRGAYDVYAFQTVPGHMAVVFADITERVRAQRAVEESERKLRAFVDKSPNGIVLADERGIVVEWNPAVAAMTGIPREEAVGKHSWELMVNLQLPERRDPVQLEQLRARLEEFYRRMPEEPMTAEMPYLHADGSRRWVRQTMFGIETPSGRYSVSLLADITDRVAAEHALREREQQLSGIFRAAPVGIGVVANRVFRQVNQRIVEMTGYTAQELVGQSARLVYPTQEDYEYVGRVKYAQIAQRGWGSVETRWRRKDGTVIDVVLSSCPLDPDDLGKGVVFTVLDITERKRAEAERDRHFNCSVDMLCVAGFDGYFKQLNPAWERTLGWSVEDLRARPFLEFVHPDDREATQRTQELLKKGEPVVRFENRYRTKGGEYRWLAWNSYPLVEEGMIYAVARDVTEQKAMHDELRRAKDELEDRVRERTAALQAANRELESFAYSVSHDLRVPLRGIDGFSQILREEHAGQLDAEGLRLLDVIRASTRRMGELIDDLLQFSRLGKAALQYAPVDLGALTAEVVRELKPACAGREVRFDIGELPVACGDAGLLRQVVANLLANAVKFTRTRRVARITVRSRRRANGVAYAVRDNGVGFDMQYAHKLFSVFQRLHHQDEFEGTGIGLATVKRIIEKHGGEVWAEGRPGKGATVGFWLPDEPCGASLRSEGTGSTGGH